MGVELGLSHQGRIDCKKIYESKKEGVTGDRKETAKRSFGICSAH
jgi:hypothetical protein